MGLIPGSCHDFSLPAGFLYNNAIGLKDLWCSGIHLLAAINTD